MNKSLPVGKLPQKFLAKLLAQMPVLDERVLLGPGIGLDCAVVENGPNYLVFKTDPITFATDELGWYAVQINTNDIATTGAQPCWLLVTLLLPENQTTPEIVENIFGQLYRASELEGIAVIGGHTEITHGLERPILVATMIGEIQRDDLVTPRGVNIGDRILLTKGVPIEGTAIIAREFPELLNGFLSAEEISQAADYLYKPGIGILQDVRVAMAAGKISAMHDPTEGGLASALWELAQASGRALVIDPSTVPISHLSGRICQALELDPLATIASGALLMTVRKGEANQVCTAMEEAGILCSIIGSVEDGPSMVLREQQGTRQRLSLPMRDEVARLFES